MKLISKSISGIWYCLVRSGLLFIISLFSLHDTMKCMFELFPNLKKLGFALDLKAPNSASKNLYSMNYFILSFFSYFNIEIIDTFRNNSDDFQIFRLRQLVFLCIQKRGFTVIICECV